MLRLSSPIEDIRDHYTVVVIGSGYGGGIAASRMARAGQSVCILERGKEFQPGEYPDTEVEALREMQVRDARRHRSARRPASTISWWATASTCSWAAGWAALRW